MVLHREKSRKNNKKWWCSQTFLFPVSLKFNVVQQKSLCLCRHSCMLFCVQVQMSDWVSGICLKSISEMSIKALLEPYLTFFFSDNVALTVYMEIMEFSIIQHLS